MKTAVETLRTMSNEELRVIVRQLIDVRQIGYWIDDNSKEAKEIVTALCEEHYQSFNLSTGEAFIRDEVFRRFVRL